MATSARIDLQAPTLVAVERLYWDPLAALGRRYAGTVDDAIRAEVAAGSFEHSW